MAVYTDVGADDLARFLDDYDLGSILACKGIAEGVENTNYLLRTSTGSYILTLYERRVQRADLPFFIGLMQHLAAAGVTCPMPVERRDGAMLGELCGRPALIVTFLDGVWLPHPSAVHCAAVGRALAGLHLAAIDYPRRRENALSVPGWRALQRLVDDRADRIEPSLARILADEVAFHERAWPDTLPTGVIHADLFPDNVFFLDDQLSGLIDFYFACNDILAYDLAICLNAWCFDETDAYDPEKGRALVLGYQGVRALTGAEVEALPVLCRGAALRFLLTRLADWLDVPAGALVKPKDPREYLARLRFHQFVADADGYGFLG